MVKIQFQRAAFWWCQVGAIISILCLLAAMSHLEASIVIQQPTLNEGGKIFHLTHHSIRWEWITNVLETISLLVIDIFTQ
jgi:hypothetical protein